MSDMIRKTENTQTEVREHMRDGDGHANLRHLFKADEITSSTRMCAEIILEKGCSIGLHQHLTEDEIYYILSGDGEIAEADGTVTAVGAGDAILTGNGQSHSIKNIGDKELKLFAIVVTY